MGKGNRAVYGDFQTPLELARSVTELVVQKGGRFDAVVEPTCGVGNFLIAAAEVLGKSASYFGFDINEQYVQDARRRLALCEDVHTFVECKDFYEQNWKTFFHKIPGKLLVIGNPPWVTNAALSVMNGGNLPEKSNFQRHSGFAAKTGKANFDISEWMLIRLVESLQRKPATLAVLCKTATARKALRHCWKNDLEIHNASVHRIDAARHFGVAVDACLLIAHTGAPRREHKAVLYPDLNFDKHIQAFGMANGEIVSDLDAYCELSDIDGIEYRKWRSGVKHDAVKVMELEKTQRGYRNGLDEIWELESKYLYPILKSSDVANGRLTPRKWVLLTQRQMSDSTGAIEAEAPQTWRYLLNHSDILDKRGSSIYAKRSRFAVFGVGPYTFSPWKVAISGLYKNLRFQAIGDCDKTPIVLDDTCYFIPCETECEARFFAQILNSDTSMRFLRSLTFFDSKRAITIDVLKRLDLRKLAERLGRSEEAAKYLTNNVFEDGTQQLLIFEKSPDYRTDSSA